MYIIFKSLKFRNVLSYGQKETSFEFKNGLNAIIGKNGEGKSTFLDALSFCLYGVPYRKIKIKELINRVNQKGLWTQCEFEIGSNHYKITRTLAPEKLEIIENGNPIDLLSTKKLVQDEIDKILGLNHGLFRQIICLAVNYNKPFLSLGAPEKRIITDSIFNTVIFGSMLKTLKKEQSGSKVQLQINTKSLSLMESNLLTQKNQISNYKLTKKNFDTDKKNDIDAIDVKITNYEKSNKKSNKIITDNQKSIDEIDYSDRETIKDKYDDIKREININESKVAETSKTITYLNNNDFCMQCHSKLTKNHKQTHIDEIKVDNDKRLARATELRVEYKDLGIKLVEFDVLIKEVRDMKQIISSEKSNVSRVVKEITSLKKSRKVIEDKSITFDLGVIEEEFVDSQKEYSNLYKKNKKISDTAKINTIIANVLSDTGIKAYFFKQLLPILNSKINEYITKFELPVKLIFDEFMDEQISTVTGSETLSYMGFSEGEKKRLDIAILLSFIETMKEISNWNCNLLFLDELLDSATDNDGLSKILATVKGMTYANSNLCVYLISHRLFDEDLFDRKIEIYKVGAISRIKSPHTGD